MCDYFTYQFQGRSQQFMTVLFFYQFICKKHKKLSIDNEIELLMIYGSIFFLQILIYQNTDRRRTPV